jgi:electron transfer flavoprotein alpha subunit
MPGVLVFGDVVRGQLTPASSEAAGAGAALARALGAPLHGALVGHDLAAAAGEFRRALATLYLVEGAHYREYVARARIAAAEAVIRTCAPSVVLFTHTLATREWVPQLAARLDTGLVLDCTALALEDEDLVAVKPVYGGSVIGEFVIRGAHRLATVRTGAFEPAQPGGAGEVLRLDVPESREDALVLLDETAATSAGGPDLASARIVVAGGRGLGSAENWRFVDEVAHLLGAAVGCSRPVADSGWVPATLQVGLSGTCVAPALYIAVGISGAVQHLAGISAAKTVVAINIDAGADIFTRATYGVVGDYREVLPAFAQRVKELRS